MGKTKAMRPQQRWRGRSYQQTGDDQALGLLRNGLKGVSKEGKRNSLASFPSSQLVQLKLAMLACRRNCTQPNTLHLTNAKVSIVMIVPVRSIVGTTMLLLEY